MHAATPSPNFALEGWDGSKVTPSPACGGRLEWGQSDSFPCMRGKVGMGATLENDNRPLVDM